MGWVHIGRKEHTFGGTLWWKRCGWGLVETGSSWIGVSLGGWGVIDELACTHVCDYEEGLEVNDDDGDRGSWVRGNLGTYSQWREWPKEFANKSRRGINVERLRR